MPKVIRARYEGGVLKPLEPIELEEGEEIRVQLLPEEFPELIDKVNVEAKEDINKALKEVKRH